MRRCEGKLFASGFACSSLRRLVGSGDPILPRALATGLSAAALVATRVNAIVRLEPAVFPSVLEHVDFVTARPHDRHSLGSYEVSHRPPRREGALAQVDLAPHLDLPAPPKCEVPAGGTKHEQSIYC